MRRREFRRAMQAEMVALQGLQGYIERSMAHRWNCPQFPMDLDGNKRTEFTAACTCA